jgi:hypothetical protein
VLLERRLPAGPEALRAAAPGAGVEMERNWHLVVAICCGIPVATAAAFAQAAGGGTRQYVVLLPVSLLLGLECATLLNMMRSTAYAHITARPAPSRSWYLRTFYVVVFAWMVAAGLIGMLAASLIWRLVP